MKDTQLYEQRLGLSKPWSVARVDLELEDSRITVHVKCEQGVVWGDPETGQDRAHIHGWVVGANYLGRRIDSSDLLPELTCCLT